jgi:hypothetical protein
MQRCKEGKIERERRLVEEEPSQMNIRTRGERKVICQMQRLDRNGN